MIASDTLMPSANGRYDIVIHYSGDPTYQAAFTQAAARWSQIITADIPDFNSSQFGLIDDLLIDASIVTIDGPGGTLGQAGPDLLRSGTLLPAHGTMQFDVADVAQMFANGTWASVVMHEIGHILGIGTLWSSLHLKNAAGDYIGVHGLSEYRVLSGNPLATSVPIEHDGGSGTVGAHWDEDTFNTELMTGYAESPGVPMPISRMTIGALQDIGYTVNYSAADPYTLPGGGGGGAQDDFADSFADTSAPFGQVALNGSATGRLEVNGDRDWFRVSLVAGVSYLIDLLGSQTGVGTLSDPYLRVHNSAGTLVAENDDVSGTNPDSRLAFVPTTTGTYYLDAGAFGDNLTGSYKLSISATAGPVSTAGLPNDFNGDGKADILFQNDNGTAQVWLLNGTSLSTAGAALPNPGPTWHARESADFDGDGKSDILWQNDSGAAAVWLMNGTGLSSFGAALPNPGPAWHEKAAADFNADGKADILWQNDNGTAAVWLMNGTAVSAYGAALPNPGPTWHEKAAADFNADGKADILWQNDNGTAAVWLMNGTDVAAYGAALPNPGPAWHAIDAADFNGDGMADILWQNDNGTAAVWLMNGTGLAAYGAALPNPGPTWHVKDAADTNGDGKADIVWQRDDGTPAVWLMNGTSLASAGGALTDPGAAWHIV